MMKNLLKLTLSVIALLTFHSAAQAAGNEKTVTMVKGSKSYQSRNVTGKSDKVIAASKPTSPEQVEPAAGIESPEEKAAKSDTTIKLQQQIKLPRKN